MNPYHEKLTCEIDLRVSDGRCERSGDDAAEVDEQDPPPPVDHLQRDAERQLHQDVEDDVKVSAVHQHVRQEPPDFVLLVGVEDEGAVEVGRSVGPHGRPRVGQEDDVPNEDPDLGQGDEE